ncbi:MAG: NADPH-dependent FMN reductase [Boseongicola sp.]
MLLGISGSLRREATNTKLIREAGRLYNGEMNIGDVRLPLYDGDDETANGVPTSVQALADQIEAAEAVVISSPEYNQSLSGVLKNALDWISRVKGRPFRDKPVALMSAAAGRSGGARANHALRLVMTSFRARLLASELLLADGRNQFDDGGRLISDRHSQQLADLMTSLREEVARS